MNVALATCMRCGSLQAPFTDSIIPFLCSSCQGESFTVQIRDVSAMECPRCKRPTLTIISYPGATPQLAGCNRCKDIWILGASAGPVTRTTEPVRPNLGFYISLVRKLEARIEHLETVDRTQEQVRR